MDLEKGNKKGETDSRKTSVVDDPWVVSNLNIETVKWSDLSTGGKVKRVLWDYIGKFLLLLGLLYLFICSLSFLSAAFRLIGGKAAGKAFSENEILRNPVAGLMIGVLVTVLVQSSSTSTSIVITMVAAGILNPKQAVPIIMGANIGTSVTNTIVSMAQSGNRNEFRRAFGGATVHDMFNWLSVIVLLPLEIITGYLYRLTGLIVDSMHLETNKDANKEMLSVITKPFTKLIVQVDKSVIEKVALGKEGAEDLSMLKRYCVYNKTEELRNVTSEELQEVNGLNVTVNVTQEQTFPVKIPVERCNSLFSLVDWKDEVVGTILLVVALVILCLCLVSIVKLLHSMLRGKMATIIKKTINANFPGKLSFLTGYVAILVGAGMTILVQSSSIFTSALTPLVGMGVVTIERVYPLTLGSNIGTTATGILASLAASGDRLAMAIHIALCHLFFNISGILLWYPIPFMRSVPIGMAKTLGNTTAKYRWFAIFYLIMMFFVLPAIVFALSLAGIWVLVGVGVPLIIFAIVIVIINTLQRKKPSWLPSKLRNWDFLPLWMHSLRPLDKLITKLCSLCRCCKEKEDPDMVIEKPNGGVPSNQGQVNVAYVVESNSPGKEGAVNVQI